MALRKQRVGKASKATKASSAPQAPKASNVPTRPMTRSLAPESPSRNMRDIWLRADAPERPSGRAVAYTGKWMLFVPAPAIDEVWARLKAATLAGTLGVSAKVSTLRNNRSNPRGQGAQVHAVMVYTRDYRDLDNVALVLRRLRELGFPGRLSYKEDGATFGNVYGGGAALYVAQPESLSFERRREPLPVPEHLWPTES